MNVLFVSRKAEKLKIKANQGAFDEYERLRKKANFHAVSLACLTETHTTSEINLFSLQEHFNHYTVLIYNNANKYKSLPYLVDSDLIECIEFNEYYALIFATIKSKTSELCLIILLLYKGLNFVCNG